MNIIVTAGGSGGHIFPALAIIDELRSKEKNLNLLYIGTHDRMEKDIIPKYNIEYIPIKVRGYTPKSLKKNFISLVRFIKSCIKVKKIIKDFKPDLVIGVGGYVTPPVIFTAKMMKIKTIIHEQNSIIGRSNKFLSKYVDKIFVSFENTSGIKSKYSNKIVVTGNPTVGMYNKLKVIDKKEYGLDSKKKLVLFVMGSQGSKTINNKMLNIIKSFKDVDYELLYVTGPDYYNKFKNIKVKNVKIVPYLDNMGAVLKATDLIVTRAGATTIFEIISFGIPSILIPSPYVANNHQYYNAMELKNKNVGVIIEENKLSKNILLKEIDSLLNDSDKYKQMKKDLKKLSINNSASIIYKEIKKMV